MVNTRRGFAVPAIIALVVAVITIGGGAYIYLSKHPIPPSGNTTPVAQEPAAPVTVAVSSAPSPSQEKAVEAKVISQNADEVKGAQAEAVQLTLESQARYGGKIFAITTPSQKNILEFDKPVTVVYSAVNGTTQYEISIVWTHTDDATSTTKVLVKKTTTNTDITFNIPTPFDGGQVRKTEFGPVAMDNFKLVVEALGRAGNLLARKEAQIQMLLPPSDPQFLRADRYIVDADGSTVIIHFGSLPTNYKRTITLACYADGMEFVDCPLGDSVFKSSFDAGSGAFTKQLVIDKNLLKDKSLLYQIIVKYTDKEYALMLENAERNLNQASREATTGQTINIGDYLPPPNIEKENAGSVLYIKQGK